VLLPAGLGTAPELLAAGGGRAYRDAGDLRAILTASGPPAGRLPAALDWDATAAATLRTYQALREGRKVA
jgi:D-inositol-3-phosphate glycosyltransferase